MLNLGAGKGSVDPSDGNVEGSGYIYEENLTEDELDKIAEEEARKEEERNKEGIIA